MIAPVREMLERRFGTCGPGLCTSIGLIVAWRVLWGPLSAVIPASWVLVDFAQVIVPFVPVDFLHSDTT